MRCPSPFSEQGHLQAAPSSPALSTPRAGNPSEHPMAVVGTFTVQICLWSSPRCVYLWGFGMWELQMRQCCLSCCKTPDPGTNSSFCFVLLNTWVKSLYLLLPPQKCCCCFWGGFEWPQEVFKSDLPPQRSQNVLFLFLGGLRELGLIFRSCLRY